jgi:hypothetical protein
MIYFTIVYIKPHFTTNTAKVFYYANNKNSMLNAEFQRRIPKVLFKVNYFVILHFYSLTF